MKIRETVSKSCCFLGHRKIAVTEDLITHLRLVIDTLIQNYGVDTFLFGSRSDFNRLCHEIVSEMKLTHKCLKRIYVRAEYSQISNSYKRYLLQYYESTYYPEEIKHSGKAAYVERNREMIEKSAYCVFYYSKDYSLEKSGTRIAYEYAKRKHRIIYNVCEWADE